VFISHPTLQRNTRQCTAVRQNGWGWHIVLLLLAISILVEDEPEEIVCRKRVRDTANWVNFTGWYTKLCSWTLPNFIDTSECHLSSLLVYWELIRLHIARKIQTNFHIICKICPRARFALIGSSSCGMLRQIAARCGENVAQHAARTTRRHPIHANAALLFRRFV